MPPTQLVTEKAPIPNLKSNSLTMATVHVSNKKGRIKDLEKQMTKILDRGTLPPGEAAQLRGRLVFALAQVFGRPGPGRPGPTQVQLFWKSISFGC